MSDDELAADTRAVADLADVRDARALERAAHARLAAQRPEPPPALVRPLIVGLVRFC